MAINQFQLIMSLSEALQWLEKESKWGVKPTELRQLVGRIGELYTAILKNGQMALKTNQNGYDVVSELSEKISVKTTAIKSNYGHFLFKKSTINLVDRIFLIRVNIEEYQIEVLFDGTLDEAKKLMVDDNKGNYIISFSKLIKKEKVHAKIKVLNEVLYEQFVVKELENGSIEVLKDGIEEIPAKPILKNIALKLNMPLTNSSNNDLTTRTLGTRIIKELKERKKT